MHKRDNAFVNMQKCTDDLMKELTQTSHIDEYLKNNDKYIITENLSSFICDRIAEKGISKAQVLRNADINEIYGYQILSGKRLPSRQKLISICIGAEFNLELTNEVIKLAGYAPLSPKNKWDSIVIFGIANHLSITKINETLYDHQLETL